MNREVFRARGSRRIDDHRLYTVVVDAASLTLPRFYPILDAGCFATHEAALAFAAELVAAGATLVQYRNKLGAAPQVVAQANELRRRFPSAIWIMNDRADLCLAADFHGVHVGQDDLSPEGARRVVGNGRWMGVSTHNLDQLGRADATSADYLAIGPVFATTSKRNPDPVIGLEGVRAARWVTRKPLVAIGGITRQNCRSVLNAGADAVAVISDLLGSPRKSAEDFFHRLG
jgi:thiamine-phosphate pyrophosphorylase